MQTLPARLSVPALLLLSLASAPAAAQSNVGNAKASAGAGMSQDYYPGDRYGDYPAEVVDYKQSQSLLVNGSAINAAGAGTVSAFSSASFVATAGGLRLNALASGSASGTPGWSGGGGSAAYADAATADSFRIFAPGYALGTLFTVNANLSLHGSVGAAASLSSGSGSYDALSSWHASVSIWNPSMTYSVGETSFGACWSNRSVPDGCSGDFSNIALQFTVANGQNTSLSISGTSRAYINFGAGSDGAVSGNAFADLGNTIAWGGITSLLDGDGQAIGDYTAIGGDNGGGFNYRQAFATAVPEPASWLLLLLGLAVLTTPLRRSLSRPGRL
jgi:hypothetical protein